MQYVREMFTSAPDRVMVLRFTASQKGKLALDFTTKSRLSDAVEALGDNCLAMDGAAPARLDPAYYNRKGREPMMRVDENGCSGMRFRSLLKAIPVGGTVTTDKKVSILMERTRFLSYGRLQQVSMASINVRLAKAKMRKCLQGNIWQKHRLSHSMN